MTPGTEPDSTPKRRSFLATSGMLGLLGLLAGCSADAGQINTVETTAESDGSELAFDRIGSKWLTFGEENDWGVQYNEITNEFEVVHNPFDKNSRKNIRIEADEDGDKGDIYIDDSLIVKNEVEVSDGSANDPSYTFDNQNDTGLWRDGGGAIGVSIAGKPAAKFDNETTRLVGDVTTTDDPPTTLWDGDAEHTPNLPATTVTKSCNGSTTTFSLHHPLESAPKVATVTPTSADAAGDFWVSKKGKNAIEITYASPPPSGTENLSYDLVVSL